MTDTALRADDDIAFIEAVCDQVDNLAQACLSGRLPATPKVQDALRQTLAQLVAIPLSLSDVDLTLRRDRAALLLADMMARVSSQVTGAVPVVSADMAPPVEIARMDDPSSGWALPAAAVRYPELAGDLQPGDVEDDGFFGPPVFTEAPPRRRWRIAASLVVAAVVAGAGTFGWHEWTHAGSSSAAAPSGAGAAAQAGAAVASDHPPAGGWTVVGDVNLTDTAFVGHAAGHPCSGENTPSFRDVIPGAAVTVADPTGAVIGSGELEPGVITALTSTTATCQFEFSVSSLPDRGAYQLHVAHRPAVQLTKAQLEAAGWNPQIRLGS